MSTRQVVAAVFSPRNSNFLHTSSSGYFLLLTFSVVFICNFLVYPVLYKSREAWISNVLFLHFVFLNIMGNYFLGIKFNSFLKPEMLLQKPPPSWRFCAMCNQHSPPRSHHCSLCQACVLKHDHHCFFLCQCVGLRNQKFFIMFTFYVAIGSFHAIKVLLLYLDITYVPLRWTWRSVLSYFYPTLLYNWIYTDIEVTLATCICMLVLYACFSTGFGCSCLFIAQCVLVIRGQTQHEFTRNIRTFNSSVWLNFSQVFGTLGFLNFFLPLPLRSKEEKEFLSFAVDFKTV